MLIVLMVSLFYSGCYFNSWNSACFIAIMTDETSIDVRDEVADVRFLLSGCHTLIVFFILIRPKSSNQKSVACITLFTLLFMVWAFDSVTGSVICSRRGVGICGFTFF